MTFKLFSFSFLLSLVASTALAAPAAPDSDVITENSIASMVPTSVTSESVMTVGPILFSILPHTVPPSSVATALVSSSTANFISPPTASIGTATNVLTVTYVLTEAPITITVSAPPSTITEIITIISPPVSSSSSPTPNSPTMWAAPAQMTDLSSFNVSAFPGGQRNLHIVNGIPASASATTLASNALSTSQADLAAAALTSWDNSSSTLQLFYPENSVNPGTKPQGGAEFYATPLPMHNANNVSLEYSIFFPVDYDWVQGGKLPGLYGGHTGCSGGNNALTCFSTRLMWRQDGLGELYLYAPKAKQTVALCSDPQSVCDATYGFSIGRGSFKYTAGGWTRVRQTVVLNTPGKQDGGFALDVNGKRVIDRNDVFYRDVPNKPIPAKTKKPTPTGILGPLLGGLLHHASILVLQESIPLLSLPTVHELTNTDDTASSRITENVSAAIATQSTMTTTMTVVSSSVNEATPAATIATALFAGTVLDVDDTPLSIDSASTTPLLQPVTFTGIFFSTFFGGHQREYATPKDQYTWFKDFAITAFP